MRIKGIHILATSKVIDTLVLILKQILSPKVGSRVHVHKSVEGLQNHLSKKILPKEYGGEDRSLKTMQGLYLFDVLLLPFSMQSPILKSAIQDDNDQSGKCSLGGAHVN